MYIHVYTLILMVYIRKPIFRFAKETFSQEMAHTNVVITIVFDIIPHVCYLYTRTTM